MIKTFSRIFVAQVLFLLTFAVIGSAQTSPGSFPNVHIKNFGQMDERFYRGAQPETGDYQALADLGVKTVIDLRNDPTDYEKTSAEAAGMKYVNIPMSGWKSPKDTDVQQFLNLLADPATGTVFVHCKAGIHRTGVVSAVYRFTKYGWDYDQAYKEMQNYEFTSGWVHGSLKGYVEDYAKKMKSAKPVTAVAVAATGAQASQ
jgi:protein tyrosine/serine phosphatase